MNENISLAFETYFLILSVMRRFLFLVVAVYAACYSSEIVHEYEHCTSNVEVIMAGYTDNSKSITGHHSLSYIRYFIRIVNAENEEICFDYGFCSDITFHGISITHNRPLQPKLLEANSELLYEYEIYETDSIDVEEIPKLNITMYSQFDSCSVNYSKDFRIFNMKEEFPIELRQFKKY